MKDTAHEIGVLVWLRSLPSLHGCNSMVGFLEMYRQRTPVPDDDG